MVLVIAVGWLLVAGRTIILTIVTALILVSVMLSASETLSRLPILGAVPAVLPKALVLAAFTAAILGLAFVVAATVRDIVDVLPRYQQNLDTVMQALARRFDMEAQTIWTEIGAATLDRIDLQRIVLAALGGFTSVGVTVFLVVIYAGFLKAERETVPRKIPAALTWILRCYGRSPSRCRTTSPMSDCILAWPFR